MAWGGGASAAVDATPPVWSKVPTASIPLGATLSHRSDCRFHKLFPVYFDYAAMDPESGIDRYELITTNNWFEKYIGPDTRYASRVSTIDEADCDGGGRSTALTFWAYNGVGLATTNLYMHRLDHLAVREDSPAGDSSGDYAQPIPGHLAYTGSWSTSACNCWTNGTTQRTRQSGASVSFDMALPEVQNGWPATRNWAIAVVMAKGPDRGKAAVFIDGVKVTTVDTYSPTAVNTTVVWRQTVSNAYHTVRIVNLATAGHPRIDIDAFVALPKEPYPA